MQDPSSEISVWVPGLHGAGESRRRRDQSPLPPLGSQDAWATRGPHVEEAGGVQPSVSSLALLTCVVKSGSWACLVLEAAFPDLSLLFAIPYLDIVYFDQTYSRFSCPPFHVSLFV